MTLAEFLLARIAEDKMIAGFAAQDLHNGSWHLNPEQEEVHAAGETPVFVAPWGGSLGPAAEHVTRWDPARVLAECEGKRRIVDECCGWIEESCEDYGARALARMTLRLIALPYADHPDYREEWRP